MPDTITAGTLSALVETQKRYEVAIMGWNYEAAAVAWQRLNVLLDRVLTDQDTASLAAAVKS